MATSAFKSTTKRTSIGAPLKAGDSDSSNGAHRRSRSLSRFSRRLLELEPDSDFVDAPAPRGKFVNTVRGSGFPEISLDDLAIEFFAVQDDSVDEKQRERGRSSRRLSEIRPATTAGVTSERRGRSVSRQSSRVVDGKTNNFYNTSGGGRSAASDVNSRRRRSVSVVRYEISDSESDLDHFQNSSNHANAKGSSHRSTQMHLLQKPTASNYRPLGKSSSHKDLSKSQDGYSSQSSALTDEENKDARSTNNMIEKTIRAVYAQKKADHPTGDNPTSGFYEAMRKELRYAVDEMKIELEQAIVRKTSASAGGSCQSDMSNARQAVSRIRKNHANKSEKAEKHKQGLLAEVVLDEQCGTEHSKMVRDLLPDMKSSSDVGKPAQVTKRSNDRNRMSKQLTEEAERYFEDFISNVEDTDLSSFDGERSDTSSTIGITKTGDAVSCYGETEIFQSPGGSNSCSVEMDGVKLPWLQWETSNDGSSLPSKNKRDHPVSPTIIRWDAVQEQNSAEVPSGHSTSKSRSWTQGLNGTSSSLGEATLSMLKEAANPPRPRFDMDRYLELRKEEDLLFERWTEDNRISSGGLLLCSNVFI